MAYIKIGPTGDKFQSRRLNINLPNKAAAASVPEELLRGVLFNLMLTGFLIEIPQVDYDNIKIDNRTFQNVPFQSRGVYEDPIIEPVINILPEPPNNPQIGDRYLVYPIGTNAWSDAQDHIAEFTGVGWTYYKPEKGWSVPIYELGLSTTYTGTYPSGKWSLGITQQTEPENVFDDDDPNNPDGVSSVELDQLRERLSQEEVTRSTNDQNLQNQINNLSNALNNLPNDGSPSGPVTASNVGIQDIGGYFTGTNVEQALQELAQTTGGLLTTVITVTASSGITRTILWDSDMVVKHGIIPTMVRAMILVPGTTNTYREMNQIDYIYSVAGFLESIVVTVNNFAARIEIK